MPSPGPELGVRWAAGQQHAAAALQHGAGVPAAAMAPAAASAAQAGDAAEAAPEATDAWAVAEHALRSWPRDALLLLLATCHVPSVTLPPAVGARFGSTVPQVRSQWVLQTDGRPIGASLGPLALPCCSAQEVTCTFRELQFTEACKRILCYGTGTEGCSSRRDGAAQPGAGRLDVARSARCSGCRCRRRRRRRSDPRGPPPAEGSCCGPPWSSLRARLRAAAVSRARHRGASCGGRHAARGPGCTETRTPANGSKCTGAAAGPASACPGLQLH